MCGKGEWDYFGVQRVIRIFVNDQNATYMWLYQWCSSHMEEFQCTAVNWGMFCTCWTLERVYCSCSGSTSGDEESAQLLLAGATAWKFICRSCCTISYTEFERKKKKAMKIKEIFTLCKLEVIMKPCVIIVNNDGSQYEIFLNKCLTLLVINSVRLELCVFGNSLLFIFFSSGTKVSHSASLISLKYSSVYLRAEPTEQPD